MARRLPPPDAVRCDWARSPQLAAYHDAEWGVPVRDDRALFEALVLGGAQAGLSWATILARREGYRRAFARFDPARVARFGPGRIEKLLLDPGIIRNRLKIASAVTNAQAVLRIQEECGSFSTYLWSFVDHRPRHNAWQRMSDVPARSAESDALAKDLKRRGFTFAGSTICYAVMQAVGMVNDHLASCFRYRAVRRS